MLNLISYITSPDYYYISEILQNITTENENVYVNREWYNTKHILSSYELDRMIYQLSNRTKYFYFNDEPMHRWIWNGEYYTLEILQNITT